MMGRSGGAKPGEAPSFEPGPSDLKVGSDGIVKPTHGISVFNNPQSVVVKGFDPHAINPSSIPPQRRIIQRGKDPKHFEIVPHIGANLTPEQSKKLACQIVCTP
jgi:hypothetical protein